MLEILVGFGIILLICIVVVFIIQVSIEYPEVIGGIILARFCYVVGRIFLN